MVDCGQWKAFLQPEEGTEPDIAVPDRFDF
jgi:hypothetical protein